MVKRIVIDAPGDWVDLARADEDIEGDDQMDNWAWFQVPHDGCRSPEPKRKPSPAVPKLKAGKRSEEDQLKQMIEDLNKKVKDARNSLAPSSSKRLSGQMGRRAAIPSSIPENDAVTADCAWQRKEASNTYLSSRHGSLPKRRKTISGSPPTSPTRPAVRSLSDSSMLPQRVLHKMRSNPPSDQDDCDVQALVKEHNRKLLKSKPMAHPHGKLCQLYEKVTGVKYFELSGKERERSLEVIHSWVRQWEEKTQRDYHDLSVPDRDVAHHEIHMMVLRNH
ncbi:hypothetical protein ACHHYP_10558 [Achlya hypogyna]|uniref:Uncharacterized protein n=1 Tax=Achlya hypogyna TaxID=1202772 RepID=A0A1V9YL32_ACHHY|nr:hypothetical protein ACHHYP_10558 [Achlya hypogyna]